MTQFSSVTLVSFWHILTCCGLRVACCVLRKKINKPAASEKQPYLFNQVPLGRDGSPSRPEFLLVVVVTKKTNIIVEAGFVFLPIGFILLGVICN